MTAKWIVMVYWTATVDEEGKDRRRYEPRFCFENDDSDVAEAQALGLSQRLNRAATVWYALVTLDPARQGPDHAQQLANAEAAIKRLDPNATSDAHYLVEPTAAYTGPTEDLTPVFVAMMTAFGQLPNPPANVFEALYRLIGA